MRILPDDGSGDTKCTLLPSQPLAQMEDRYSALSYYAGGPKVRGTISGNGVESNAGADPRRASGEMRGFL